MGRTDRGRHARTSGMTGFNPDDGRGPPCAFLLVLGISELVAYLLIQPEWFAARWQFYAAVAGTGILVWVVIALAIMLVARLVQRKDAQQP
jgi:hypothetical protein